MNEFIEFLTTKEALVVYAIVGVSCLLCFIIYCVEKNNVKVRQRHNTRELNKLVQQIHEETEVLEEEVVYEQPILVPVEEEQASSVVELLESTMELERLREEPIVSVEKEEPHLIETLEIEEEESIQDSVDTTDQLMYTTIEPDQETAQLELKKLTEELKKQEELIVSPVDAVSSYETQQEENAIISLDELVRKSKSMYEANEVTQYVDEANEPISLKELETVSNNTFNQKYAEEPFIIESVVLDDEGQEEERVVEVVESTPVVSQPVVSSSSVSTTSEPKRFQSSPIISPIFGIEKPANELALENTANYEKLDAEIKKTNEFLMTLKDLQKD